MSIKYLFEMLIFITKKKYQKVFMQLPKLNVCSSIPMCSDILNLALLYLNLGLTFTLEISFTYFSW